MSAWLLSGAGIVVFAALAWIARRVGERLATRRLVRDNLRRFVPPPSEQERLSRRVQARVAEMRDAEGEALEPGGAA